MGRHVVRRVLIGNGPDFPACWTGPRCFAAGAGSTRQRWGVCLNWTYTLGAYQVLGLGASYEVLYVATTRANATLVQELIEEELIRLKVGEIDLEELDKAKTALIGAHEMSLQTIGALANQTALDELYDIEPVLTDGCSHGATRSLQS